MGYIASYFALKVAEIASAEAINKEARRVELCHCAGVPPDLPAGSKQMIADSMFFDLLERVASDEDDGFTVALRVGETMRCDDYGAFGFAFKTAQNLKGSFQRVERYGKVVTNVANYTVEPGAKATFMAVNPGVGNRLGLHLTNELAIAAGTALCRELGDESFSVNAIHFAHPAPKTTAFHEDYFQCPVIFSSKRNGLEISNEVLCSSNALGDYALSQFFESHLESELAQLANDQRLEGKISQQLVQALSEGVPSIEDIASRLGMSSRTLQRRLADEGVVYQSLVDETRKQLAIQLLNKNEFSLAEIAFLTGYSEQSTFTRAFKRWQGLTPASYRRSLH